MATELRYWKREGEEHHTMLRASRISKSYLEDNKEALIACRPVETALITFDYTQERNSAGGIRPYEIIWGTEA